jgi:rhodanese-related sulfurtransferase
MIPDVKQEILLITYPNKQEEAITRLSRVGYVNTIGFLEGGFDSWTAADKEYETVGRISPTEFESIYNDSKPLVFDVRKKSEYDSEHIVGAINVPLNEINEHLSQFPKEKFFVLHCAGGYRSMIAASILKQRGWEDVVDVDGGFAEMKNTSVEKTEYVCPTTLL